MFNTARKYRIKNTKKWVDQDQNRREESTKVKSINLVVIVNTLGSCVNSLLIVYNNKKYILFSSNARYSDSFSDSDHHRHKRSRKQLDEVERLTEIERSRKAKEIEEKVRNQLKFRKSLQCFFSFEDCRRRDTKTY